MNERRRRTEINIETRRVLTVRGRGGSALVWCDRCGTQSDMVSADEAALLTGVSARVIYRWVESDQLHFAQTAEGLVRVCLNSLASYCSQEGDIQLE